MTASCSREVKKECILCGRCLDVCPVFRATNREELSPKAKHWMARLLREGEAGLSGKSVKDLDRAGRGALACRPCPGAAGPGLGAAA